MKLEREVSEKRKENKGDINEIYSWREEEAAQGTKRGGARNERRRGKERKPIGQIGEKI